ncbi:hypothetical protein KI387_031099, partial [Taxus chinensis]
MVSATSVPVRGLRWSPKPMTTISVIAVREGLVQLGATKKVIEDLNFVIMLQRKFHYLQTIPGVFLPHPSSNAVGSDAQDSSFKHLEKCLSWNGTNNMTGTLMEDRYRTSHLHNNNNSNRRLMMMMMPPLLIPPVMPSMSSLQALLSKLPSVTNSDTSTAPLSMSNGFLTRSLSCPRQSFSEP